MRFCCLLHYVSSMKSRTASCISHWLGRISPESPGCTACGDDLVQRTTRNTMLLRMRVSLRVGFTANRWACSGSKKVMDFVPFVSP